MLNVPGNSVQRRSDGPLSFNCLESLLSAAGRSRCFGDDCVLLRLSNQTGRHEVLRCVGDTRNVSATVLPLVLAGAQLVDGTTVFVHHLIR